MQKVFTNQDIQIAYTDNGTGSTVVLLHGFGEDGSIWQQQVVYLSQYFRVIVPDIPGSGNSPLLQKQDVSIDDYASCIHQLVEDILPDGDNKIILLGHSMGGYITLSFAKLFPQKLNAFGLIHSTAYADSEEKKLVRLRGIETIKQYGAFPFLKTTIPNLFGADFKQNNTLRVDALIERSRSFTEAALEQYYLAMMKRTDTTDVLKNSQMPVLFIMGTEDVAAPIRDVLQQCHLPQQSHIKIFDDVGHMGMMEAAVELNTAVKHFIDLVS